MAIWLNYTHFEYHDGSRLLPNYAYFLNRFVPIVYTDKSSITPHILDGTLLKQLSDSNNNHILSDPLIRKILLEAYLYEVEYKFMQQDVVNNEAKNVKLIKLFDQYFQEDYRKTMLSYCTNCDRTQLINRFKDIHHFTYTDRDIAVQQYLTFISQLLTQAWYQKEVVALKLFAESHLIISYQEDISWVAWVDGENVKIKIWNSTYVTLFHELTHFVMDFFDEFYPDTKWLHITWDSTKNNEWFANFMALHFYTQILEWSIDIWWCAQYPLFFSMYIDIYATLIQQWSTNEILNHDIVAKQLRQLGSIKITDNKIDFYYQRFYKYFHYDQHTALYPKELLYYLGYSQIREAYCKVSEDQKVSYIVNHLMWVKHL